MYIPEQPHSFPLLLPLIPTLPSLWKVTSVIERQRLKKSSGDQLEDMNGCTGSDPKHSANLQSCLQQWPRLDAWGRR